MPETDGQPARRERDTRGRILAIAQELFARQGYAGTSIADIAQQLGTSKSALYYHFRSKSEIVKALAEEPVAAYSRLAADAAAGRCSAAGLLAEVISTTASLHAIADVISNDPSARAVLQDLLPRSHEINDALTAALAGPRPDAARVARAHAAYAAAKNGTLALLSAGHGQLTRTDHAELLAAALRALA